MEIPLQDGSRQSHFGGFCYQKQDGWKHVLRICQHAFVVQFVVGCPIRRIELLSLCGRQYHCNKKDILL